MSETEEINSGMLKAQRYSVFTYRIYNKQSLKPFQHIMSIVKHVCPINEQHSTLPNVVKS